MSRASSCACPKATAARDLGTRVLCDLYRQLTSGWVKRRGESVVTGYPFSAMLDASNYCFSRLTAITDRASLASVACSERIMQHLPKPKDGTPFAAEPKQSCHVLSTPTPSSYREEIVPLIFVFRDTCFEIVTSRSTSVHANMRFTPVNIGCKTHYTLPSE